MCRPDTVFQLGELHDLRLSLCVLQLAILGEQFDNRQEVVVHLVDKFSIDVVLC